MTLSAPLVDKVNDRGDSTSSTTGEDHTIGEDTANVVWTDEAYLQSAGVTVNGTPAGGGSFTETSSGSPSAGEFSLAGGSRIDFHANDNSIDVTVDYTRRGSELLARDMNRLKDAFEDRFGSSYLTGGAATSLVGFGTGSPLKGVHVQRDDLGLTGNHLGDATEDIHYVFVGESSDAVVALASQNEGNHGSGIDMLQVTTGTLDNKWSLVRHTSGSTATPNHLAFYYGTNAYYPDNNRLFEMHPSGDTVFRQAGASSELSFDDGWSYIALIAAEPRIRGVADDSGTWGTFFTLDQYDVEVGSEDFENVWSMGRQTNGDGNGDGRLVFTYGTNKDPATNTAYLTLSTGGIIGFGSRTSAATPANFSADFYIQMQDRSGNAFYIPGMSSSW